MSKEGPRQRRYKDGIAFTIEQDAVILELVAKGKPLSAAVRLGCESRDIFRRAKELIDGKTIKKDRRPSRFERISEERRQAIRAGLEAVRERRGEIA